MILNGGVGRERAVARDRRPFATKRLEAILLDTVLGEGGRGSSEVVVEGGRIEVGKENGEVTSI